MAAGLELSTYEPGAFRKVPVHLDRRPETTFDLGERLGPRVVEWLRERYDDAEVGLSKVKTSIPMALYRRLSLDEMCKLRFGTSTMMDQSVEDAFEKEPGLAIYRKITSSMWRWGVGRGSWNEIVDAYEGIRRFDMGHPDFEVRFDHSTWFNECGYSEHSRTYLDGVFGYLVHYRGEHVMTLGFSVMAGRRILIQQVQLRNRRGNRWLFKLPGNYLEHVIGRFREGFPRHRLFLVDGREIVGKSLASYRNALAREERRQEEETRRLARCSAKDEAYHRRSLDRSVEEARRLRECIAHAEPEVERLGRFYDAVGRNRRGRARVVNGLTHHELEAC